MFTGIVEGAGRLLEKRPQRGSLRLKIQAPFSLNRVKKGESIAVNGCCLTVVSKQNRSFETDVSSATLKATNLGSLGSGDRVNLERAVALGERLNGHLVQGHVDGVGRILSYRKKSDADEIQVTYPAYLRSYFIPKGSVTVDGVSLTIQKLTPKALTLVVIPHTLSVTNLRFRRVGELVNLETDMIAKYLKNFLGSSRKKTKS